SKSIEPVNDNFSVFPTISLFDNDKINSDEINSHVESNSNESTSNHDTMKFDNLDEFYGPLISIHILEEERIRREHHEYFESEDSDFDNPPVPLPPPEPPDEEFYFEIDFETEISVVRNTIVKFEVFNDENDDLSYFMFVIFDKEFSFLSAESEDTIFDPDDEVDVDGNVIQNSEHEYSESEDTIFDPVLRKGLPKINGTRGSAKKSRTTKSAGK
nr:hypothetical protein [Tanacetum cinerariifolium]